MTNFEKAFAFIVMAISMIVLATPIWLSFHQIPKPTVIQARAIPTWADHEAQYYKLVEGIRSK